MSGIDSRRSCQIHDPSRIRCRWRLATPARSVSATPRSTQISGCPIDASLMNTDGKPDVAGGIALFRQKAEAAGRNPDDIPISLFAWGRPPQDRLESYAELGVERVVLGPGSFDAGDDDETMPFLERFTPMVAELA